MKIKTKDLIDKHQMLSHIILKCLNQEANDIIKLNPDRNDETEYDIKLTFENVELDITNFSKSLDKQLDAAIKDEARLMANELFKQWKHRYKSKNSNNAKLQKIKEQFDNVKNQLSNIGNQIERFDF